MVDHGAAKHSDPRRVPWGADVELRGPPPAIVLFAPHKTGSTFFTSLLHDVAALLGLCWYSDNAAFMFAPNNHTKCASPSCGHFGAQRSFASSDRGWGDCSSFADEQLRAASACAAAEERARIALVDDSQRCGAGELPLSAENGVAWGVVRLPDPMRRAIRLLGKPPWRWYVILHQRHPGDTLVSAYHSFGWSHPAAPTASAAQQREHASLQSAIRNASVDEYAAEHAADLRSKYVPYFELLRGGGGQMTIVRSRYEEMVGDFPRWLDAFVGSLRPSYTERTLAMLRRELLKRHRNAFNANGKGHHKRSVVAGRFDAELRPEAASKLRRVHREWWEALGYT